MKACNSKYDSFLGINIDIMSDKIETLKPILQALDQLDGVNERVKFRVHKVNYTLETSRVGLKPDLKNIG